MFELKISPDTKGTRWGSAPKPQGLNLCNTICNTWLGLGLTFNLWLQPLSLSEGGQTRRPNILEQRRAAGSRGPSALCGSGRGRGKRQRRREGRILSVGKDGVKTMGSGARRAALGARWGTLN